MCTTMCTCSMTKRSVRAMGLLSCSFIEMVSWSTHSSDTAILKTDLLFDSWCSAHDFSLIPPKKKKSDL